MSARRVSLLCLLAVNSLVYWGAMALTAGRTMLDMTTALDRALPVVPVFTVVYVGAYAFWGACYGRLSREADWPAIFRAELGAKLVCFLCFVCLPTTNLRPALTGDGCSRLLAVIYALDRPVNLFPSIHCLDSWLCWAALRSKRSVPAWARGGACASAMLICLSTLLIRQHVLADVAAGILLAEGCLGVSKELDRMFT